MLMEVTCRCGWSTRGSKSAVIRMVQAHAQSAHNLAVSPQEIRAIWRSVEDAPPEGRRRSGQPQQ
jgi:predicted small metal-binding protein